MYSQRENGRYCLPCVFFARSTDVFFKGNGALFETAFNNFKKMYVYDIRDTHTERVLQGYTVAACKAFVQVTSGEQERIHL